jgi:fatty acid desaturase
MEIDEKKLDRDAAQVAMRYMGAFAWKTVLLATVLFCAYAAILYGTFSGQIGLVLAFTVQALVVYAVYTVFHETVHGNVSGSGSGLQWLNGLLGYIAGFILLIPFKVHKAEHFAHHRSTNDVDVDPDHVFASENPFDAFVNSLKTLSVQFSFYFTKVWPNASAAERISVVVDLSVIIGGRVLLAVLGFPLEVLVLMVLANVVGNYITVAFFAWLVHHPHSETGRYVDTTVYAFPKWLDGSITWLWLFQNYHAIHHLFPRVPFYEYKKVFGEIRHIMVARGAPIKEVGRQPQPVPA